MAGAPRQGRPGSGNPERGRLGGVRANPHAQQFIKYAMVGLSSTAINFVLFGLLVFSGIHYLAAAVVAYAVATLNGYVLNSRWTYRGGTHSNTRFLKFSVIQLSGLVVNLLVLAFLVENFALNKLLAQVVANAFVVLTTFGGNKFWTFRR